MIATTVLGSVAMWRREKDQSVLALILIFLMFLGDCVVDRN